MLSTAYIMVSAEVTLRHISYFPCHPKTLYALKISHCPSKRPMIHGQHEKKKWRCSPFREIYRFVLQGPSLRKSRDMIVPHITWYRLQASSEDIGSLKIIIIKKEPALKMLWRNVISDKHACRRILITLTSFFFYLCDTISTESGAALIRFHYSENVSSFMTPRPRHKVCVVIVL
ncbi:hypothetical protein CDAR_112591 [Caerostris darwini]|uniref:Uncharacterized protein n=1 Tax=Caerostris darwini TaxID=1538125 RepID=A0AAV4PYY9_9ARAC|nr:hypothetical protein CDAR_112591 [Caerostris darwini]